MNKFHVLAAAAFLPAATMFVAITARAMEIEQYDKMSNEDQSEYVALLVGGAEQAFQDEGRADLAAQVDHLFTTTDPGDAHTIGVVEFQLNLARARVTDEKNVEKNPSAHRLEVEDAMLVTWKKNNIPLSQEFIRAFRAVNSSFKPKSTPQSNLQPALRSRTTPPVASRPTPPDDDDPIGSGGFITPPQR